MYISRLIGSAILASGLLFPLSPVLAQGSPGYFIPPSGQSAPARPAGRPAPRVAAPTQQFVPPPPPGPIAGPAADEPPPGPPQQMQLPPAPDLPPMPKGTPPPAAVIGVLGIPDIMRISSAAQQVERIIGERREKLSQDAQKEQAVWREMQQALANQRGGLNPEQIRAKERELQERITTAQRVFRDRNRIIQEAGQYGLAQIERMLISVIREVAESRGMNLVLHRAQVALNVNEFDITGQVVEQLNKVLPSVVLPPEGVEPPTIAVAQTPGATPATITPGTPAPTAAPAAAPPPPSAPVQGAGTPRR